jgi:NitT/TauT family transport system ATP-binding protein
MIRLEEVSFGYPGKKPRDRLVPVLAGITTELGEGNISVFLGPSGCGKTTLLNILAGITKPSGGIIDYTNYQSKSHPTGYVFQTPSLIPWRTIRENALFGAEITAKANAATEEHCNHLLRLYGLAGFENSYPATLSVGMQQRVSIIRAVLSGTRIILLDEPFSNSDFLMRRELHAALSRLVSNEQLTAVMATHDIEEAVRIADKVIVFTQRPASVRGEIEISIPRDERINRGPSAAGMLAPYIEATEQMFASVSNSSERGAEL